VNDFPGWKKPPAAGLARYASRRADDLGAPPGTPPNGGSSTRGTYAASAPSRPGRASGLHGVLAGAGDAAQVTATGTRKPAGTETEIEFAHYDCGNGLGAVVSRGALSYGREDGLWEAALARTAPDGALRPPDPGLRPWLRGPRRTRQHGGSPPQAGRRSARPAARDLTRGQRLPAAWCAELRVPGCAAGVRAPVPGGSCRPGRWPPRR
jgi:hypothetical protein